MKIEIDQSGKIESTNRMTVVAFSNSKTKSISISAKDKKSIQSMFRKIGRPKLFTIKVFAAMIFCLIKDEVIANYQITIDLEYPGHEQLARAIILEIAKKNKVEIESKTIHFKSIGKGSPAHKKAITAFRKRKADDKLSAKEFFKIVF